MFLKVGKKATAPEQEPESELPTGEYRGKGVRLAHEAIAVLKKIPRKDGLRQRGMEIVVDWITLNK